MRENRRKAKFSDNMADWERRLKAFLTGCVLPTKGLFSKAEMAG